MVFTPYVLLKALEILDDGLAVALALYDSFFAPDSSGGKRQHAQLIVECSNAYGIVARFDHVVRQEAKQREIIRMPEIPPNLELLLLVIVVTVAVTVAHGGSCPEFCLGRLAGIAHRTLSVSYVSTGTGLDWRA